MDVRSELIKIRESGSKIIIVGAGISGLEAIKYCLRNRLEFEAVEKEPEESFLKKSKYKAEIKALIEAGAPIFFGINGERIAGKLNAVKLAVLSPGVPIESAVCAVLKRHNIPFISELELAVSLHHLPSVVVTGSNGKSTTVSLIHDILLRAGYSSQLCGNVGMPVIASAPALDTEIKSEDKKILVVEASSYQLETCTFLKPDVAILLNISENHLERHGDLARYLKIKAKIFENQDKSNIAILGADDPKIDNLKHEIAACVQAFGIKETQNFSHYAKITCAPENGLDFIEVGGEVFEIANSKLRGLHNRYNIAAAILAAQNFGVGKETIDTAILNFSPLEHRLEFCGELSEIRCINDSKATTVAASMAALRTILNDNKTSKITLLLGGLSKAGSWDPLCAVIKENEKSLNRVVCFGKDAGIISSYCKNSKIAHLISKNLRSALEDGIKESAPGDIVLFSPGCASFDEFNDFEERGREFKKLIVENT
jgi:UDP-N-acetylmuramoylalanine--D-glutamate ligase